MVRRLLFHQPYPIESQSGTALLAAYETKRSVLKLLTSALGLSLASLLAAGPALAQDALPAEATAVQTYVGVSGGYHDLGDNPLGDNGGIIGGGVVGFDVPLSSRGLTIGAEGNFHVGTGAIDTEYGVAGRVGYRFPSGGLFYVRGGYQWVNVDIGKLTSGLVDEDDLEGVDVDDTVKDYLVGVGGEFPVGTGKSRLRVGVDTVSFDTWRPNVAFILGF